MKERPQRTKRRQRGSALLTTFAVLSLLAVAAASFIDSSTQSIRQARRQTAEVQTTHLCEAGVQEVLRVLWRRFKKDQDFDYLELVLSGANSSNPKGCLSDDLDNVGVYSAGVIDYRQPPGDPFSRLVTIRSVGFLDRDGDGSLDDGEIRKVVDVTARFELARSQVFDYAYFVNNYGWMKGFRPDQLIINGDARSNGNFEFMSGRDGSGNPINGTNSGTVNGSLSATANDKLDPPAAGLILRDGSTHNAAPVKWAQSTYNSQAATQRFWRQGYDPAVHGARGSDTYEQWRDYIFDTEGAITRGRMSGAVMGDVNGLRGWTRTHIDHDPSIWQLDESPTREVIMPDLSDLEYYKNLSQNYRNPKDRFGDGTINPRFNRPAYAEVWDPTYNNGNGTFGRWECVTVPVETDSNGVPLRDGQGRPRYIDVNGDGVHDWRDSDGVMRGSVVLVGTTSNPIRLNGPVTITEDVVINGVVQGQGTIYAGRNVHIVGNVTYLNQPDFRRTGGRTTHKQIEDFNEKQDFLGLAARGSIMMGNYADSRFRHSIPWMRPPNTKRRKDEDGNWIPAFDAMDVDGQRLNDSGGLTQRRRYESSFSNATINAVSSSGVNRVDAILYTNFVGGGMVGTGGGGMTVNGTLISRDEAIVTWSVPIRMNYDHRIRERTVGRTPLIDLRLPRSPVMLRSTWQDRGFSGNF
jgi:hypothetical protein